MPNFYSMVQNYKFDYFKKDLAAALGVAAISLPQAMAFALLAGVNPIYGLYTFIISNLLFVLIGRSNYMIVGPTNMISVTIASSLNALEIVNAGNYLSFVFLLTFLVGIFQMLLGFLKIGNLVNYVSKTVITAITSGVSLIIISGQLDDLLQINLPAESGNVITSLYNTFLHLENVNYYALLMGLFTMALVLIFKYFFSALPSYLMALIISIMMVPLFDLQNKIQIVGNFQSSLPVYKVPNFQFQAIKQLSSSALSIAILGFTQVLSIVKVMEEKKGVLTDLNKEFIGQGFINIICSFFSSFAITGSFSRSFTNLEIGARTRVSGLIASITVFLFIMLFGNIVGLIPIPSLAGIVILVAVFMFDIEEIVESFSITKTDTVIFIVTFITTILTPRLDYAIYFGVIISGIMVLRNTSDIHYSHIKYEEEEDRKFTEKKKERIEEDDYRIINFSGSLHFNTAENLKKIFEENFEPGKVFILRLRRIEKIDLTAAGEIEKFIDKVQENGGEVILSGVDKEIYDIFEQLNILDKIGTNNCFTVDEDIFHSTKKAIDLAENKTDSSSFSQNENE